MQESKANKYIVEVKTDSQDYPVLIGRNILSEISTMVKSSEQLIKVLIVSDDKTSVLFAKQINSIMEKDGYTVFNYVIENGEKSKTIDNYANILEFAAEVGLTRSDAIVALGGGVVGDLAGFTAGTYLRGIDFYQVPTTLLADVDSSVGGKTAVNLNSGKNLVGVFMQPKGVVCDIDCLNSLSKLNMADGLSEIIKYGMIYDNKLFTNLMSDKLKDELPYIVRRCVEIKAEIVGNDELDRGERQLLNFGHTIGHSIEKLSNYGITHGHAVAIGMSLITKASYKSGICAEEVSITLNRKLKEFNLPTTTEFSLDEVFSVTLSDKKRSGDSINIIVPTAIGECSIKKIKTSEFKEFLKKGWE